jgi:predicted signal transduction protein with EAL and GGDEF domain
MVAERLRTAFQEAGIMIDGHELGATVSIGVATTYATLPDLDALILRADAALYAAKNGGRNRHYVADNDPADEQARLTWAARSQSAKPGMLQRKFAARRARQTMTQAAASQTAGSQAAG